jgi:RNA polymerase sigma factor (sigma-70 family)
MVWAIARAHRLNDADAGDVFQSTWMKCLERLNQIRDPARVGAWLATTARRECLHVLRASRRQGPWGDNLPESESQGMTAEDALSSPRATRRSGTPSHASVRGTNRCCACWSPIRQ